MAEETQISRAALEEAILLSKLPANGTGNSELQLLRAVTHGGWVFYETAVFDSSFFF